MKLKALFALLLFFALFHHSSASAQVPVQRGAHTVGIPAARFQIANPEFFGRQRSTNWCWAASVQMVLGYYGMIVPQEAVVARLFGGLFDTTVSAYQLSQALTGWSFAGYGYRKTSYAVPIAPWPDLILHELAGQRPLIVGLNMPSRKHVMVLTAATYDIVPYTGQKVLRSVVLRDPLPFSPSRQEMSWDEFVSRHMATLSLVFLPW